MIKVWKQKGELFYYVAIEYLYYKLHGIHAVQGLDGKNEMIVHKQICYYYKAIPYAEKGLGNLFHSVKFTLGFLGKSLQ